VVKVYISIGKSINSLRIWSIEAWSFSRRCSPWSHAKPKRVRAKSFQKSCWTFVILWKILVSSETRKVEKLLLQHFVDLACCYCGQVIWTFEAQMQACGLWFRLEPVGSDSSLWAQITCGGEGQSLGRLWLWANMLRALRFGAFQKGASRAPCQTKKVRAKSFQ